MCANIDFAPPCLLKIMGDKIYWGRGVNFMMQNWKRELEELLYHLGIYLSQDGYPVICAAADLVLQGAGAAAAADDGSLPGGGQALRLHSGQRGTQPPHHSRYCLGSQPDPLPENGHERNYPATHGRRFPLHGAALPAAGLRGIVLTGTGARSWVGPKFFFLDFLKSSKENPVDRMKGNRDNVQFAQRQRGCFICSVN